MNLEDDFWYLEFIIRQSHTNTLSHIEYSTVQYNTKVHSQEERSIRVENERTGKRASECASERLHELAFRDTRASKVWWAHSLSRSSRRSEGARPGSKTTARSQRAAAGRPWDVAKKARSSGHLPSIRGIRCDHTDLLLDFRRVCFFELLLFSSVGSTSRTKLTCGSGSMNTTRFSFRSDWAPNLWPKTDRNSFFEE